MAEKKETAKGPHRVERLLNTATLSRNRQTATTRKDKPPADEDVDYAAMTKDELEAEAAKRNLTVTGSGSNGNVVKDDLIAALEASDKK